MLIAAGMFGFFFLDSLYLRRVLGYDAVATGLAFLPVTIAIGAFSLGWAAQLAGRFGARVMVIAGITLAAAGLFISTVAPLQSDYFTTLFPAMVLIGVGMGVSFPTVMMFAMSDVTPQNSGLVSGLVNTTAQAGGALGLAIFATLSAARTNDVLASGIRTAAALGAGYHFAFGAAAIALIAAAIVAATVLRPSAAI